VPFAMIYDFFGYFAVCRHPLDLLLERFWNHEFSAAKRLYGGKDRVALFVGEPEDVPDRSLGFLLPNCRERAEEACRFLGYIVPFDPGDYRDKEIVRAKLGYGDEPLVICTVGGTAVGKELLELCGRAYPLIRDRIPNLRMVLVCGPRLECNEVDAPPAVEIRGYVPMLYEHLAACDLAIVQGGGSTTLELTALQRPFLYFPLEGHFEQCIHVAGRVARHGAGVELSYSETGPEALAEKVVANLGRELNYPPIPTDGASKAAEILTELMKNGAR
jgi:predicted glycosyltransferase